MILPPDARDVAEAIEAAAAEAHGATRAAGERLDKLRAALGEAESMAEALAASWPEESAAARARADDARASLHAARAARDAAAARAQDAHRLAEAVRAFLARPGEARAVALPSPAKGDRAAALAKARAAVDTARTTFAAIDAAPPHPAELAAAALAEVDRLAAMGRPSYGPEGPSWPGLAGLSVAPAALLAWTVPGALRSAIERDTAAMPTAGTLRCAERETKLADASAALLMAERAEEAEYRAAAAAGLAVQRRGHADPRAVLAIEVIAA